MGMTWIEPFLKMFLDAKRIEGCSERTIIYYQATVKHLLSQITTEVRKITTEEIREYLSKYQKWNNCSNVTIDNVRRNISSFFSWLEEEDYILKSPMKRIHKIKTKEGIPCGNHRARQMTKKDYEEFDYLIGMEQWNIRNINRIIRKDPEHKVHLLLEYAGEARDIADPWYTGNFDVTYEDVKEGCEAFLQYLIENEPLY